MFRLFLVTQTLNFTRKKNEKKRKKKKKEKDTTFSQQSKDKRLCSVNSRNFVCSIDRSYESKEKLRVRVTYERSPRTIRRFAPLKRYFSSPAATKSSDRIARIIRILWYVNLSSFMMYVSPILDVGHARSVANQKLVMSNWTKIGSNASISGKVLNITGY